jgi:hypothetical protein
LLSLAFLGRKEEAIAEARPGLDLHSTNAILAPCLRHQPVRIYMLADELRRNPRFQKLVAGN